MHMYFVCILYNTNVNPREGRPIGAFQHTSSNFPRSCACGVMLEMASHASVHTRMLSISLELEPCSQFVTFDAFRFDIWRLLSASRPTFFSTSPSAITPLVAAALTGSIVA